MFIADKWKDYEILDSGDGEKLERWGDIILARPDPQVIWPKILSSGEWKKAHALYSRSSRGGGRWTYNKKIPLNWDISYMLDINKKLIFSVEPTSFKHTGLFPEQAVNWEWMAKLIRNGNRPISVLNLFAYTGGATVACAAAGASVCHVDASKGMVQKAKNNVAASLPKGAKVRYIVDDVLKFVRREKRRGNHYDAVIMDPPSYGRGPGGEVWTIEKELFGLVGECAELLSIKPLFFLVNSYTTGLAPIVQENILRLVLRGKPYRPVFDSGEIGLPVKNEGIVLPCGSSGRVVFH